LASTAVDSSSTFYQDASYRGCKGRKKRPVAGPMRRLRDE